MDNQYGLFLANENISRNISQGQRETECGDHIETISCRCLNVRFKLSDLEAQRETSLPIDNDVTLNSFLIEPKRLVAFSDGHGHGDKNLGAQIIFPDFIVNQEVQGWIVSTCFNCKTVTHAVSFHDSHHVYVNVGGMLSGCQQQTVISKNPNYSKLFGLVTYSAESTIEAPSVLKPSIMDLLRRIKERSAEYIEEEKGKMKKRVREYEAVELATFEDLQSTVSTNKINIEQQILAVFNDVNDDADSAYERSVEEIPGNVTTVFNSNAGKKGRSSSIVDEMFDLDPFADDNYDDGDDSIFTDDETEVTPNYKSRSSGQADMGDILAKSVPIPIRREMLASASRASESSSDDDTTPQPQDMQASIKALAQSVGGDGTEMFGDLPRHRFKSFSTYSHSTRHY